MAQCARLISRDETGHFKAAVTSQKLTVWYHISYYIALPDIRYYIESAGKEPLAKFFDGLRAPAAARVTVAIARLEGGDTASLKPVGLASTKSGSA